MCDREYFLNLLDLAGSVADTGQALNIADAQEDKRFNQVAAREYPKLHVSPASPVTASVLVVPAASTGCGLLSPSTY